jgi:hypothetical protein
VGHYSKYRYSVKHKFIVAVKKLLTNQNHRLDESILILLVMICHQLLITAIIMPYLLPSPFGRGAGGEGQTEI